MQGDHDFYDFEAKYLPGETTRSDIPADLPHVVGILSDLDGRLAARAVESLRAELRRREELVREAGDCRELLSPRRRSERRHLRLLVPAEQGEDAL